MYMRHLLISVYLLLNQLFLAFPGVLFAPVKLFLYGSIAVYRFFYMLPRFLNDTLLYIHRQTNLIYSHYLTAMLMEQYGDDLIIQKISLTPFKM